MSSNSQSINIEDLLAGAASDAGISAKVTAQLVDASTVKTVRKGDGVTPETYRHSSVEIITILVDDSGSIFNGEPGDPADKVTNDQLVREGVNGLMDALLATKKKGQIIISIRTINGVVICPYVYLEEAPRLDTKNFRDGGGTPFIDESFVTLASVIAKAKSFDDAALGVRAWTVLLTDGDDRHSRKSKPQDIAELMKALDKETHTVMGFGVSDGKTDFKAVFLSMGIREENILVSANDPSAIRAKFRQASQSATGLKQTSGAGAGGLGGFGA